MSRMKTLSGVAGVVTAGSARLFLLDFARLYGLPGDPGEPDFGDVDRGEPRCPLAFSANFASDPVVGGFTGIGKCA